MINFDVQIRDFPFTEQSQPAIEKWHNGGHAYGSNWPVVYIIHNDQEAYVGESLNVGKRMSQHLQNSDRKKLKMVHIMADETFNKSVILDLESYLIKYMSADRKYRLQNSNAGLSDYEYYGRKEYIQEFSKIWEKLRDLGLVRSSINAIEDSDFYKYSPYKSLTKEQQVVLDKIMYLLVGYINHGLGDTIVVEGGAGTGKTIMAIFLLKLLEDLKNGTATDDESEKDTELGQLSRLITPERPLKVGLVIPQQSLQVTLKKVFKTIRGLSDSLIYTPREAAWEGMKEPFDLLICDEAHRLHRRASLSQYPPYDKINKALGLNKQATELEWLMKVSNMQLFFYDNDQSVRPSDITPAQFDSALGHCRRLELKSQLRCLGGADYIQYVKEVLNVSGFPGLQAARGNAVVLREGEDRKSGLVKPHGQFEHFRTGMYDNLDEMMDEISRLDDQYHLCCAAAGYAWKWITEKEPADTPLRDIPIGRGYIWNHVTKDWISSEGRQKHEIGCIHTVQGYDLNYVGVIFGPEIIFSKKTGRIEVVPEKYVDKLGKAVKGDYEALRRYIINIYATLLTRGIRGTLVYVCDPDLREYLRPYFSA